MLTKEELRWAERYWTTANYLAASSVYLQSNFFLEKKLVKEDIKDHLKGHWGTCPGINFIYTHLNLLATKKKQSILLVNGPGHGFAAILANLFLEGSLSKYLPAYTNDKKGIGKLIRDFCLPGGFPSHQNPRVPGVIYVGGELGYALSTAYGAAFGNPGLIVAAIISDGASETGPAATAWHSNKFLNPEKDGAVLPILHLNGYKINNPSIYATMDKSRLKKLFEGYGYNVKFVGKSHIEMADTLDWAYKEIKKIQTEFKKRKLKDDPRWPLIILETPKGWTCTKEYDGHRIEGSWRSHQVPLPDVRTNKTQLTLLERWLKSYKPSKLFPEGKVPKETFKFVPRGNLRIGMNKHANGGLFLEDLVLPKAEKFEVKFRKPGVSFNASTPTLGEYLKEMFKLNKKDIFRIVSPDELASNKLGAVLDVTGRRYIWKTKERDKKNCDLKPDGKVMEMLSEHTLQGWLQGYILTGRHGLFPSYEAFLPIVDSMISQHIKFIEVAKDVKWRKPVSSLNYIATSVCWRQDHNGFSHQNPGFIDTLLSKEREEKLIRIFFPADANSMLAVAEEILNSKEGVNAIVADKRQIRQWRTLKEAREQMKLGAAIWNFESDKNPEIILATCGDYQTQEMMAAVAILREKLPYVKLRFVNVSELNVLGYGENYPRGLSKEKFEELFTKNKPVIFSFHGYPSSIKQLLFDRDNTKRFDIHGYMERGTTTTPFEMLVFNKVSRYHIVMRVIENLKKTNPQVARDAKRVITEMEEKILEHQDYILKNGADPEEINDWKPR